MIEDRGTEHADREAGPSAGLSRPGSWGRKDLLAVFSIAAVSLLFHLVYFRYGVQNLVDLGVACVDTERILNGQVPGVDFMEPYGPGRFYLTALAFMAGGSSILTFSILCLGLLAVKDVLVFLSARYLLTRSWSLYVAALCIVVHGPLHKVFLTLSIVLILLPALRLVSGPGLGTAFVLGLGVSAAGLFRYDVGAIGLIMALLLTVVLALGKRECAKGPGFRERPAAAGITWRLAAGITGGLALLGGTASYVYFRNIDPVDFIEHHLKRIISLHQANAGMPGAFDLPGSDQSFEVLFGYLLLFLALTLLATTAAAIRLWMQGALGRRQGMMLALVILLALLLYNQVRLGVKFSRLSQIAPPYFILVAYLFMRASRFSAAEGIQRAWRWLSRAAAAAFFGFLVFYIWEYQGTQSQDSFASLRMPSYFLDLPRARCYFKRAKGMEIEKVIRFLEQVTDPGEPIFTGPSCPLFHFLADRPNPTPFTDFTFYYFDADNQRVMIDAIERADVRYMVNWPRELTGFLFVESAPVLTNYITTRFYPVKKIGRFVILRRRD